MKKRKTQLGGIKKGILGGGKAADWSGLKPEGRF